MDSYLWMSNQRAAQWTVLRLKTCRHLRALPTSARPAPTIPLLRNKNDPNLNPLSSFSALSSTPDGERRQIWFPKRAREQRAQNNIFCPWTINPLRHFAHLVGGESPLPKICGIEIEFPQWSLCTCLTSVFERETEDSCQ